jgi:hypothetical protein
MAQNRSMLLRIPLELRNEVYLYLLPHQLHAYLHNDRLRLSTCFEPDKDPRSSAHPHKVNLWQSGEDPRPADAQSPHDGSERRPYESANEELVYVRRLQSSWGPHWMCEERAGNGTGSTPVLLLACRKM